MDKPGHTIVETQGFLDDCREAGVSDTARAAIVDAVAQDPRAGDLIQGAGGVLKRRFAGRGKGKSGGFRVMIAYLGKNAPAYILALLSKGDRENYSRAEVNAMKKLVAELKRHWKQGQDHE